jgi:transposase
VKHTALKIFEVIQEEGYEGGYTAVKDAVRALRRSSGEVFVPLIHHPGEAQMDFGQALVKMGGVLRKVMFFASKQNSSRNCTVITAASK